MLTQRELEVLQLLIEGLTDSEIGQELGLALNTVKWYNKRIYRSLDVSNRTQAATRARERGLVSAETGGETLLPQSSAHPNNLPAQVTSFIGRRQEIEQVQYLLKDTRLLTISGPAGSGKTRLALEVANALLAEYYDGVYFVQFAAVRNVDSILWTIAEYVHFQFHSANPPLDQFLEYLQSKTMLLVLDNFEHLLAGTDDLAKILRAAPHLVLLVTSRERLNLYGETNYVLGGMSTSGGGESSELFRQRAQSVNPNLDFGKKDIQDIGRICELVEGLPLGIELAATWADILSPKEIADEIEQSIDILEAEQHGASHGENSMRAAIQRSWDLLDDEQQRAFRTLSVFRGGFTRVAASAVTGITLRMLHGLVSKSLLRFDPIRKRYEMHELLRQYAEEELQSSGEINNISRKHAQYFANFMQQSWTHFRGNLQAEALHAVGADIENIRTAWQYWIIQSDPNELRKFLHSLWVSHDIRGWYPTGIRLFEQAADVMQGVESEEAEALLGWVWAALGLFRVAGGYDGTRMGFELAQDSVDLLRRLQRRDMLLIPLISLCITAMRVNEKEVAISAARECLSVAEHTDDDWGIAKAKQLLAIGAIENKDYAQAEHLAQTALHIFEKRGDKWSESVLCIEVLGLLEITCRRLDNAIDCIKRGLTAAQVIDFEYSVQMAYWQMGYVEALRNNYLKAGEYWQKALASGDRVIGSKHMIGFGGSISSGDWSHEVIE